MKRKTINTHYTLETRTILENKLNDGISITEISKLINRDRSNIAREILRYRKPVFPSSFNNYNVCSKHEKCDLKEYECYLNCKLIDFNLCEKLKSSPHVCNGCDTKKHCRHVKYYYKAENANMEYLKSWSNDRSGLHYSKEELNILNVDFYGLVIKNKSIYHSLITINNKGYNFNLTTIYKQIKRGQLKLKSSDLPRSRKRNNPSSQKDKSYKRECYINHTYEDYEKYKSNNSNALETQMDTVEGIKNNNEPVLLTLEIICINFLFVFKLNAQKADNVKEKLSYFKNILTDDTFNKIMEITLTDNGKEFNIIDYFKESFPNVNLYYCHPYSSYEKGNIENCHELLRRVIPQGVSLKPYTQEEFNLLCSHVNSLCRQSLNGKCPFDLIEQYISKDKLKKLGLKKINPEDVELIPELLGNKNIQNIKKYLDNNEIKRANIKFKKEEELMDIQK